MAESSRRTLTRERILDVALRHLARYGYRKTSLADIARELGVVKGALYYHLPGGKAEVFDAVVRREREGMLQAMREAAERESSAAEALRVAIHAKLDRLRELAKVHGVPRDIGQEITAHATAAQPSFNAEERELYEEILRRGEERHEFRRIEPRSAVAAGLQAMVWALEIPEVYGAEGGEPVQGGVIAPLVDLMLNGLKAPD
jgi:AcrR family transcriptional regulator